MLLCQCNPASKPGAEKDIKIPIIQFDPDKKMKDLHWTKDMNELLAQSWDNSDDVAELKLNKQTDKIEFPYRGLFFFKDGSVIKNPRGSMQTGKWKIDSSSKPIKIMMQLSDEGPSTMLLAFLSPYKLKLTTAENKQQLTTYTANASVYINEKGNPFHISNNAWRLKPAKPEKTDAIKKRLEECIHFFILFYDDNIYRNTETVSFYGLPSCFRWYAGGIYLQKENVLDKNWVNCFYNASEAMEAYRMAEKLLAQKYVWPKGETNWLKQNVYVLKQMEKKLVSL